MDKIAKAGMALERIKAGLANFKLSRCLTSEKDDGLKTLDIGRSSSCVRNGITWHLIDIEGFQNMQRFKQTIVGTEIADIQFPQFYLRSESIWDLDVFGNAESCDFLQCPSFTARFHLTGPDREALRRFFTSERLAAVEQLDKIDVAEGYDSIFIYYRPNFQIEAEASGLFLDQASMVLQHMLLPPGGRSQIGTL
jgi:hypothetical protein